MRGSELRQLREARGVKAVWMAKRMGLKHRQRVTQLEDKKDVSVDEFVRYLKALDLKPGDFLENSGGVRPDLRPIVDELGTLTPAALLHARDLLRVADKIAQTAVLPLHDPRVVDHTTVSPSPPYHAAPNSKRNDDELGEPVAMNMVRDGSQSTESADAPADMATSPPAAVTRPPAKARKP